MTCLLLFPCTEIMGNINLKNISTNNNNIDDLFVDKHYDNINNHLYIRKIKLKYYLFT